MSGTLARAGHYTICGKAFERGELPARAGAHDGQTIEATVEVRHVDTFGAGVEIRQMSGKTVASYARLLECLHGDKLA